MAGKSWKTVQFQFKPETSNIKNMSQSDIETVWIKSEPADVSQEVSEAPTVCNSMQDDIPDAVFPTKAIKNLKRKAKKGMLAGSSMCLICNKEYVYEAFLTRHMVSKHRACEPIHQYKCRHCGAIFADEAGFEKHKARFFEFLKHHLERVKPKELEQENEVTKFEEFMKAAAEGKDGTTNAERENGVATGYGDLEKEIAKEVKDEPSGPVEKRSKEGILADYEPVFSRLYVN